MRVKDPGQIRRWRKQCRYSQRELAFLCRKSQNAISLVEKGELKNITEDFAVALAGRLGVPWEDLFEAHEVEVRSTVSNAVHRIGDKISA
ncbi:helix-turn-helix domain-containing protein [Rhodococcus qingshengii]|uniref:helix-turn-helix domain-containing protein n=1 Tax=Rhodococcus qingshengii TaxID=334542 RepID=UPI00210C3FC1|nr:helix-turn-helix transcriptional regulator [Rhodococcus qingshengii]MCQ4150249.1 helix-turn-helix domain-containing protein [Rhodococcus qingshengii]